MSIEPQKKEECCLDEPRHNPKKPNSFNRNLRRTAHFGSLLNPISYEVTDTGELKQFFENFKGILVPHSGTSMHSCHSLLDFHSSLCALSPTRGAVIQSIHDFSFHNLKVVSKLDSVFNINKNEELTEEQQCDFIDFFNQNIVWHKADGRVCTVRDFNTFVFKTYKESGNCFIELVFTETLGVKKVYVYAKKTSHCLYLVTKKGEPKEVVTSPIWSEKYLKKHTPIKTNLFPDFSVDEKKGIKRTMIHLKNGTNVWYGRPEAEATIMAQYLEYQQYDYLNKETKNRFMGKLIIEIEDGDPDKYGLEDEAIGHGFDSLGDRINKNFSASADDPQSVFLMMRPSGSSGMTTTNVPSNTNQGWYKEIGAMLKQAIIDGESWSVNFMNSSASKGFQTQAFKDEYLWKMRPIIKKNQKITNEVINLISQQVLQFFGIEDLQNVCIEWEDSLEKEIEDSTQIDNDYKAKVEAYGIAVRAGLITQQVEDEEAMRRELGLPELSDRIKEQWQEEGNTNRKPTTLKSNEKEPTNAFGSN